MELLPHGCLTGGKEEQTLSTKAFYFTTSLVSISILEPHLSSDATIFLNEENLPACEIPSFSPSMEANSLKDSKFVASLGACSFGIYLIHPIPMNLVKGLIVRVFPTLSQQVSIASMLTFSVSSFLLSWLIVSLLSRNKMIAKYTRSYALTELAICGCSHDDLKKGCSDRSPSLSCDACPD